MSITWSDVAEADLDDLYDYIARDVPYYAEQFVDRLMEAVGTLRDHPRLGRRVPEADDRDDVRELIFQGYRIIYLVTQSTCIYRPSSTAAGIWRGKPRSRGRSSKNSRTLSQALLRCSQSKPIRAAMQQAMLEHNASLFRAECGARNKEDMAIFQKQLQKNLLDQANLFGLENASAKVESSTIGTIGTYRGFKKVGGEVYQYTSRLYFGKSTMFQVHLMEPSRQSPTVVGNSFLNSVKRYR